jgi:hypothetical protein
MADAIDQIIAIYQKDDPEDAGFYTRAWVQDEVATFNQSAEEFLAGLLDSEARIAAIPAESLTQDQPWTKNLPADQIEKFSGPIDGHSYQLMKDSGELDQFDALNKEGKR